MSTKDDSPQWPLPKSPYFVITSINGLGRAVIAQADIAQDDHLFTTTEAQSPLAHVILRPYRREVCAFCFNYDRGRDWKIRDHTTTTVFCSLACQTSWQEYHDFSCVQALSKIEAHIREQSKHLNDANLPLVEAGYAIEDQAALEAKVAKAWQDTEEVADEVRLARTMSKPSKWQRSIVRRVLERKLDADILMYTLSGVISAYKNVMQNNADSLKPGCQLIEPQTCLPSLFELVSDERVFNDNPMTLSPLHDYTSAYLVLLALVPIELINIVCSQLIINLASRAAHNAFSIRPGHNTDGEQSGEFIGWGVWPEASFFNHSCRPNVRKERNGRQWSFFIDSKDQPGVSGDQQLCITYLGGDEEDLDVLQRRQRLEEQWGFICGCDRCSQEGGEPL